MGVNGATRTQQNAQPLFSSVNSHIRVCIIISFVAPHSSQRKYLRNFWISRMTKITRLGKNYFYVVSMATATAMKTGAELYEPKEKKKQKINAIMSKLANIQTPAEHQILSSIRYRRIRKNWLEWKNLGAHIERYEFPTMNLLKVKELWRKKEKKKKKKDEQKRNSRNKIDKMVISII